MNNINLWKDNDKPDNSRIKWTGITMSPLLVGCVQFRKLKSILVPFIKRELSLWYLPFDPKDGVRKLSALLKNYEHPNWKDNKSNMTDNEQHAFEFFRPQYLSVAEWDPDILTDLDA